MNLRKSLPKLIKPMLSYPNHAEFEKFLNFCGSMTKQLEDLGHHFSISLLHEDVVQNHFERYTLLNLDHQPIVLAVAKTRITDSNFSHIIKSASTIPLGKFIFAKHSEVYRAQMTTQLNYAREINHRLIGTYLKNFNYQNQQLFWVRYSKFNYYLEQLDLIEIILPEVSKFLLTS